jgi:POT family proton-dependent oligopeptide transporter
MVVSMVVFQAGRKSLIPVHATTPAATPSRDPGTASASRSEDWQRITSLLTLFAIASFFWVAFYQNGSSLTLFAERSTVKLDWLKPETYQVFNPLFILLLTPVLVAAFGRLREKGREPSSATKIFTGMVVMGSSVLIMVLASWAGGNRDENIMSPMWLIWSYFFVTISEILVSPMGLSFVSKVAPPRMRGLMMGGWFAATAIGGYGSGFLGKYYSRLDHHEFFLIIAAMPFCAALLVLPFLKRLNRFSR